MYFKQGLVNFNLHAQPLPLQLQQQIVQQNSPMMTLPSNLPLPAQSANIGINHASSGTSSNSNINLNPDSNLSAASYGSQPSDKELDVSHNCDIFDVHMIAFFKKIYIYCLLNNATLLTRHIHKVIFIIQEHKFCWHDF